MFIRDLYDLMCPNIFKDIYCFRTESRKRQFTSGKIGNLNESRRLAVIGLSLVRHEN